MKKLDWYLYSIAAVGVIIVIAINVYFYQIQQHRKYLRSLGLHGAAVHFPHLIPEIAEMGVDINELDADGHTPLHMAVTFKKVESVKLLLDRNADPNIKNSSDKINPTALHDATFILSSPDEAEIVKLLLKAGADPNVTGNQKETPLHRIARTGNQSLALDVAKDLIDAGADVNSEAFRGMTPLQSAVALGNTALIDLLLTAGADAEQRNDHGFRAIDQINASANREEIQKIFEKHGADSVRRPELFAKYRKDENSE
ncbi:ankyrin repeat domain-containing protein [Rubinisphaera italica]|uniref:Ankyrin repeats (3 copies) n=1 Tax=Rubinisphaera italica TaxID=2527969 RepID=A0A5C5XJU5_9PLAN|nr:ankyrin repeat domain-containing protein [Rubinisphaera italica]TWT63477.1 Ankyrin repeats (3 copies) [Rubinisphaera italica]